MTPPFAEAEYIESTKVATTPFAELKIITSTAHPTKNGLIQIMYNS